MRASIHASEKELARLQSLLESSTSHKVRYETRKRIRVTQARLDYYKSLQRRARLMPSLRPLDSPRAMVTLSAYAAECDELTAYLMRVFR